MFVVFKIIFEDEVKYERVTEFPTLEEANKFLLDHKDDGDQLTIMME